MYRLLKESHIRTVPPLPDKLQAQDLLGALRTLRLDPQHHHPAFNHHCGASGMHNGTIMNMAKNTFADHSRWSANHVDTPFDPGPTSPTQPSALSSSFKQSPRPDLSASNIPTSAPGSLSPVTYGSAYDFARPSQPRVIADQLRSLSSHHATSDGISLSSGFMPQESWQPDCRQSISPMEHPLHRCRHTSGEIAPQSFPATSHPQQTGGGGMHDWSWSGPAGLGIGYYGSNNNLCAGGSEGDGVHDSNSVMDCESIEQRGGIVMLHDSHAHNGHGKWHGAPLN